MRVKIYLVLRNVDGGGQEVLAARLTQGAADLIAQGISGAYTRRWVATKELEIIANNKAGAAQRVG